jgi:chloride channel protein, CIC family
MRLAHRSGLFAPMLVLGLQSGLLFGMIRCHRFPSSAAHPTEKRNCWAGSPVRGGCAVPANGIILATELTGGFTLLLPMLAACFAAMLVPTMLQDPLVYDSLR